MKRITFNGRTYTCTLSGRFRPHTAEELDAIRASAGEVGVRVPVRLYFDTDLGLADCVLDGEGRLTVAAELGLASMPTVDDGRMGTEAAYGAATVFNDARRQDDPEAVRRRRAARIARVAAARSQGMSLRAIAKDEGVSPEQVRQDIKDAPERGVATTPPPKVTGLDGKKRDAQASLTVNPLTLHPSQSENSPPVARPDPPPSVEWFDASEDDAPIDDAEELGLDPDPDPPPGPNPGALHAPRKCLPKHFKPGNKVDPDHPYANILKAASLLAGAITKAMAAEGGERLKEYLTAVQVSKPPHPLLVAHRALMIGDKKYGAVFVGLRPLRKLVKLAGTAGRAKTPAKAAEAYTEAGQDDRRAAA